MTVKVLEQHLLDIVTKCNEVEELLRTERTMTQCIEKILCEKESECSVLMSVQKDNRKKLSKLGKELKNWKIKF